MRNLFRGIIFFRKPNGELGFRVRNSSAKVVRKTTPVPTANRRAALVLGGTCLGATTWWFGEPKITDSSDSGRQSVTEIVVTKLEDY